MYAFGHQHSVLSHFSKRLRSTMQFVWQKIFIGKFYPNSQIEENARLQKSYEKQIYTNAKTFYPRTAVITLGKRDLAGCRHLLI